MDKRNYYRPAYYQLKNNFPNWPLSYEMTKLFITDISDKYEVLERNPELIHCNILYNGVLIKKNIICKVIPYLKELLKRKKKYGKNVDSKRC